MFTYKNYEVVREDEHNIVLYQTNLIEERIGNPRKGIGLKKTGKKIEKRQRVGYFGTFSSILKNIVELEIEKAQNVNELKEIIKEIEKIKEGLTND